MEEIQESYALESVEQLRVIADELRQRILDALTGQARTVTQVGEMLGVAPAKIHYHVRELERVGLVRLVATREKGGILEKYFRSVARIFNVPSHIIRGAPADEKQAAAQMVVEDISRGIARSLSLSEGEHRRVLGLGRWYSWMTDEEATRIYTEIEALFRPFAQPRGIAGEQERTVVTALYDSVLESSGDDDAPSSRTDSQAIGILRYARADLERALDAGTRLDIVTFGHCTFADDVTPELADRAIARFRHNGTLDASPEVREVLARKEHDAT